MKNEKGNRSHTLHFCKLNAMEVIEKIRKVLRFLIAYHHEKMG